MIIVAKCGAGMAIGIGIGKGSEVLLKNVISEKRNPRIPKANATVSLPCKFIITIFSLMFLSQQKFSFLSKTQCNELWTFGRNENSIHFSVYAITVAFAFGIRQLLRENIKSVVLKN